eukprot:11227346-Lingulodinium_polyedra.AAC.1
MPLEVPEGAIHAVRPEAMRTANEENQRHGQRLPGDEVFVALPAGGRLGLFVPGEGVDITATRAIWVR